MKHSITRKIALIMICLVAGTVLLCWILNNTLLEKYYINNKQNGLQVVFTHVSAASEAGTLYTDTAKIEDEVLCSPVAV